MALKTKVRADQVVSNEDGIVDWITDAGKMMKSPVAEITIVDTPAPEAAAAPIETPAAEAPFEVDIPQEEESKPEPAPKKAAPAKKVKPAAKAPEKAPAKVAVMVKPAAETPKPLKAAKPSKPEEKTVASKAKKKSTAKGTRTIGGKEVDLSKFVKVKAPGGGTSYNNGDATAKKLEGKNLDDVYKIVAKDTKQDEKALRAKYKHLNVGMQRMALGNMHRKGPREEKKKA